MPEFETRLIIKVGCPGITFQKIETQINILILDMMVVFTLTLIEMSEDVPSGRKRR